MVCPKLKKGNCSNTKKPCKAKYHVKMIKHKNCKNYKSKKK
ncbi:MAG: hypothetical protein QXD48_02290 [Candidatus Aenigmatarchaeota archaeon]